MSDYHPIIEEACARMMRAKDQRTGAAIYLAAMFLYDGPFVLLNDAVRVRWSEAALSRVKKAAWAMRKRCAEVNP